RPWKTLPDGIGNRDGPVRIRLLMGPRLAHPWPFRAAETSRERLLAEPDARAPHPPQPGRLGRDPQFRLSVGPEGADEPADGGFSVIGDPDLTSIRWWARIGPFSVDPVLASPPGIDLFKGSNLRRAPCSHRSACLS